MAAPKRSGLGKGLGALISETTEAVSIDSENLNRIEDVKDGESQENIVYLIDINKIKPNENQPRKHFNEEKLEELAASIKNHGVIQPVILRKVENGFEIVAGERRWRAARKAGLREIPGVVRVLTDEQNMLLAIIENMQREDLNPIEEAEAVSQMIGTYGFTQEEVSKSIGKSRPYITNSLRLLKLSEDVRAMVREGRLSAGHARALITIEDEKKQLELAKKAADEGLSVRETERLSNDSKPKKAARPRKKNADVLRLEEELKEAVGTKVNIRQSGKGGKVEILCYNREELERIIELLRGIR
ncbi:MAG: ParB/RepB/Spo0J family partition protein [Clostridia bacterium]|nr:ParB/RepB/Spo0J family partition protein [Clostridia bacterium]